MSESVGLKLIGKRLHAIQAEQRTLRGENTLIRQELGRLAGAMSTRDTLNKVLTVLVNRIAHFVALMEARMDEILTRLPPVAP